ncbi:MAG TPA: hypothetical protein VEC16_03100 [Alphaproteobacteria bacterium]|nr:hypothetical protein [Alphaproteobacteria bacterium]
MVNDQDNKEESSTNSNSWKKAGNVATKVGKGTLIAGGAVLGGLGAATLWAGKKTYDGAKSVSDSFGESLRIKSDNGLVLFFIIALLTHFIDAVTKFQRPGIMMYVYVILIIYAFFFMFGMRISGDEGVLIAIIGLAYMLPYLPDVFPNSGAMLTISGLLFLFPVLPLYIGLKFPDNTFIGKITKWYIVFWVIVLVFFLLTTFNTGQMTVAKVKDPFAGVRYVFSGVSKTLGDFQNDVKSSFDRAIAMATGQAYEGQEESKVGIYVENVKSLESKYTTNSNVFVEAKIKAVNVKERVNVTTLCYITGVAQGKMTPSLLTDIEGNYENIVTCNFGNLPEGTYTAKVVAVFEFESSSDIEYTFVDSDVKSDQYQKLGINSVTLATYTGGPVELGLPSLTQPLRVNTDAGAGSSDISTYPFGVSLKNKWTQGKINKGLRYTLDVPSEISLIDCSSDVVYYNPNGGRKEYVFAINTNNAQAVFDAVSCRMKFDNPTDLLDNNIKSTKTFAAKAKYEYAVEGTTVVLVERN